jgi:nucleoside-diphosphate-sugar epimerase
MNIRDNFKAKRYLVTGASGFIGRAVCARLLNLGATVHGTSRRNVAFDSDRWTHSCADLSNAKEVDRLVGESKPEFRPRTMGLLSQFSQDRLRSRALARQK